MASHSYIFNLENKIIAARQTINDARDAILAEARYVSDDQYCYPENRDVWGTLHQNVLLLESCVKQLLEVTSKEFPG